MKPRVSSVAMLKAFELVAYVYWAAPKGSKLEKAADTFLDVLLHELQGRLE